MHYYAVLLANWSVLIDWYIIDKDNEAVLSNNLQSGKVMCSEPKKSIKKQNKIHYENGLLTKKDVTKKP